MRRREISKNKDVFEKRLSKALKTMENIRNKRSQIEIYVRTIGENHVIIGTEELISSKQPNELVEVEA